MIAETVKKTRDELDNIKGLLLEVIINHEQALKQNPISSSDAVRWAVTQHIIFINDFFSSFETLQKSGIGSQELIYSLIYRCMWERYLKLKFISEYLLEKKKSNESWDNMFKLVKYDECIFWAKYYKYSNLKEIEKLVDKQILFIFSHNFSINEFADDTKRKNFLKMVISNDSTYSFLLDFHSIYSRNKYISKNDKPLNWPNGSKIEAYEIDYIWYSLLSTGVAHGSIEGSNKIKKHFGENGKLEEFICNITSKAVSEVVKICST